MKPPLKELDLDAREAEILGKPQRIAPLKLEDFDAAATALVEEVCKTLQVDSVDKVPSVFGVMLKHQGLFRCQMETGVELLGRGAITPRERELAILRVGWLCGAPYEWGEHVEIAKRCGVSADEIERVTEGSSSPGWNDLDRAIIKAVEELLGEQLISDPTWDVLARSWSERQLIELPVLVGQDFMIALQHNALRVRLSSDNKGFRQR